MKAAVAISFCALFTGACSASDGGGTGNTGGENGIPWAGGGTYTGGSSGGSGNATGGGTGGGSQYSGAAQFVHREGKQLIVNGSPIVLKGVGFTNWFVNNDEYNLDEAKLHHDADSYTEIKAWGFNHVRFYMHHAMATDEASLRWLDENVQWAKAAGVFIVLDMHVPPGGYQSTVQSHAGLWNDAANQNAFVAAWRILAERYANEPTIAGFDLLNEPHVTESRNQWQDLANRTIEAIREKAPNHLLIVEKVYWKNGTYFQGATSKPLPVNDENVAYSFHFYDPYAYTDQRAPWNDFGWSNYPDSNIMQDRADMQGQMPRTKAYLEANIKFAKSFQDENNYPAYMGEFGVIKYTQDSGGATWISDMLSIAAQEGLSFSYHSYHDENYGLYGGWKSVRNESNRRTGFISAISDGM